jgi:hypothetical protein
LSAEQEALVNSFTLRSSIAPRVRGASGIAAFGLVAAMALSGCGAGQISQTAMQEPSVNGTSATVGNIALRNVQLRAAQKTDQVQPGSSVDLLFVAANLSPDRDDRLVSITSDVGIVALSGDTTVPAGGVLVVGEPDGQTATLGSAEKAQAAKATVDLSKPISNGLTYGFTFSFEHSGQTTLQVPISAGETRREAQAEGGDTGGHH